MKIKKLFSGFVSLILVLTMIFALVPVVAEAKSPLGDPELWKDLAKDYTKVVYHSPEEKLATMTKIAENDNFALYVQEYTAEVAVVDRHTGQMLFTNPWDVADSEGNIKSELMSQIILKYTDREGISGEFNSYSDAVRNDQVTVKQIRNGVRVEYVIGNANKRILAPHRIEKSRFETLIMKPFFEATTTSGASFEEYIALKYSDDPAEVSMAGAMESFDFSHILSLYSLYDLNDPTLTQREKSSMVENYPVTETMAIYIFDEKKEQSFLKEIETVIKTYTKYSLDDLLSDHAATEYEEESVSPPVFRMALEYTLEEDGMQVRLPARGISYDAATYNLGEIQVLMYLGAGRVARAEDDVRSDVGYNFIPDGSGTIINFDNGTRTSLIAGTMYGSDYGFYTGGASSGAASYQTWRIPVFGTVREETIRTKVPDPENEGEFTVKESEPQKQGYVAFMTEGESLTRIEAHFGVEKHEYSSTSTTFFARQTDSYPLDGITVSGESAYISKAIDRRYVGNYTIKYRLLWGDEASYVGMANAYRDFLIKEGVLPEDPLEGTDSNLYLDLLGDIDNTVQFLGIPIPTKAALTTFENAETIMNELQDAGVKKQILRYLGWMNGGMASTAPAKMDVEGKLGGKKGLKSLIAAVQEAGNQIYMDFDFSYVKTVKWFDGFDEGKDTAKTIDGKSAFLKTYNPIVQAYNTQVAYVVAANRILSLYSKVTEKYSALFENGEKCISVGTLGDALSSNQDKSFPLNREDAKSYVEDALRQVASDYDHVIVENGNIYTWRYAEHILNIPLDSSNRNDTTAEVPFIGILLHGYKHYTGEAINLAGDYEYNILKTIESGADPYFVLAYQNTALLKTNGYGSYYAVNYETWKDKIISEYKRIDGALGSVRGSKVTNHEILENRVVRVTYENGCTIYLNYNNFEVVENGITLPAMDFVVKEGR